MSNSTGRREREGHDLLFWGDFPVGVKSYTTCYKNVHNIEKKIEITPEKILI